MGCNCDAVICFGIEVSDKYALPWVNDGIDIEDWWEIVKGFKSSLDIFTKDGEYIDGKFPEQEAIDTYYLERDAWWEKNRLPVSAVCIGHYEEQEYILAIPETISYIAFVEVVPVKECIASTPNPREIHDFMEFIKTYLPDIKVTPPDWLVSSHYG